MKKNYYVTVAVNMRIDVLVEAESFGEAKYLAEYEASEADLNEGRYYEYKAVNAEDEDGNEIDY